MDIINDKDNYKEECKICGPCMIGCFYRLLTCFGDIYICVCCQHNK